MASPVTRRPLAHHEHPAPAGRPRVADRARRLRAAPRKRRGALALDRRARRAGRACRRRLLLVVDTPGARRARNGAPAPSGPAPARASILGARAFPVIAQPVRKGTHRRLSQRARHGHAAQPRHGQAARRRPAHARAFRGRPDGARPATAARRNRSRVRSKCSSRRRRASSRKDQALLTNAQVDLERYKTLLAQDSIAKQQVDTQEALVRQYQGDGARPTRARSTTRGCS